MYKRNFHCFHNYISRIITLWFPESISPLSETDDKVHNEKRLHFSRFERICFKMV